MEWWLFAFVKIMIINLILSGDNAIIIAMASRNLPIKKRNFAVFWGVLVAVVLRILLTILALQLLQIPYLTAVGALLLIWIALKLVHTSEDKQEIQAGHSLYNVVMTIILADFIMSLDNVIAVAAVADGNLPLIIIGVLLSIPFIVWGSRFVLALIEKFPSVIYIGAGILGFTAGEMLLKDQTTSKLIHLAIPSLSWTVPILLAVFVVLWGWSSKRKAVNYFF